MDFKSVPNLQWIFKQQRWVFKNSYGFLKTAMGFQKQTSLRSHLAVKLRGRLSRPPRPVAEMSFGCAQCHLRGPNRQTCTLAWVVRAGGRYKTSGTNHYCAACVLLACKITKAQEYLPGFCTRCKSWVELSLAQLNKLPPPPGPRPGAGTPTVATYMAHVSFTSRLLRPQTPAAEQQQSQPSAYDSALYIYLIRHISTGRNMKRSQSSY